MKNISTCLLVFLLAIGNGLLAAKDKENIHQEVAVEATAATEISSTKKVKSEYKKFWSDIKTFTPVMLGACFGGIIGGSVGKVGRSFYDQKNCQFTSNEMQLALSGAKDGLAAGFASYVLFMGLFELALLYDRRAIEAKIKKYFF